MATTPIIVVQGGQWGSEAKGAIAAYLCLTRNIDMAVRTGAINAGHTVVYKGQKYAMQQLPTGWVNPNTLLVIGAGAYIHPETLWREIDMVNQAMPESDVRDRLYIDFRCGLHSIDAENASKSANRHHAIGATGKGCSEAIVAKISKRNNGYQLFYESAAGTDFRTRNKAHFVDTAAMLNSAYDRNSRILIEGTQGTLLDLHLGPYPFTTSRMTTAANWVAECGLSPALDYEVVLVCRTFPIRVAGNSGPMSHEIEWVELAHNINSKLVAAGMEPVVSPVALHAFEDAIDRAAADAVITGKYKVPTNGGNFNTKLSRWMTAERDMYRQAASELHRDAMNKLSNEHQTELRKLFEMTTVTKKLRRIANLSMKDLRTAVMLNRPSWLCITFMDYLEPVLSNFTSCPPEHPAYPAVSALQHDALDRVENWCESTGNALGVPVKLVSFGPAAENVVSVGKL